MYEEEVVIYKAFCKKAEEMRRMIMKQKGMSNDLIEKLLDEIHYIESKFDNFI